MLAYGRLRPSAKFGCLSGRSNRSVEGVRAKAQRRKGFCTHPVVRIDRAGFAIPIISIVSPELGVPGTCCAHRLTPFRAKTSGKGNRIYRSVEHCAENTCSTISKIAENFVKVSTGVSGTQILSQRRTLASVLIVDSALYSSIFLLVS